MTTTVEPWVEAPGAGVIDDARARQSRHRRIGVAVTAAGLAAIVLALLWGGGSGGAGQSQPLRRPSAGARALAERSGGSRTGHLLSIVGVSLVVPREWFGQTSVLWTGAGDSAWLQTTNFPTQTLVHGEDPRKAMGPRGLIVTICEECLPIQGSVQHNRVRPLTLASDVVPASRTPRGHLVIESSAVLDGRLLTIDADFGSRNAADHLLAVVNRVLSTLRVRRAVHG
jgi:hypothetical protein